MLSKSLVLDANIVIRSVLGERVRNLIIQYYETVDFFVPDICLLDARKYIPQLLEKRKLPISSAMAVLDEIEAVLNVMSAEIYDEYRGEAQERMKDRDIDDWPIVAAALLLDCPVWTEDKDFFGSGISIWTTDRIHLFLQK